MTIHHTIEFKIAAVIQFKHSERSATQLATRLGISCKTLLKWTNDNRYTMKSLAEVDSLRVEVQRLRDQCEVLKCSWQVDRRSKKAVYAFIAEHQSKYAIELLCATFDVEKSGYYAWKSRSPSAHEESDVEFMEWIERIFEASHGTYGSPRIHAELIGMGRKIARKRVARLMKKLGLCAITPRPFKKTTLSDHDRRIAPNLLNQDFKVAHRDRVWVADITYIWTDEGWLYLSMLLDLYSRRVVGWTADSHMRDELVLSSLRDALNDRGPELDTSLLTIHTDRGSQYASDDFIEALDGRRIARSMSAKGCCYDNAVAESFFATLKKELVYRTRYRTRSEAIASIANYIERFYNRVRRHSSNEFLPPCAREAM
jgi:putative transposase